ncbi:MAG: histidine phosphatase family protein [Microbacterium sp.]
MKKNVIRIAAVTATILAATTLTGLSANAAQPVSTGSTSGVVSAGGSKSDKNAVVIYLTRHGRTILNQTDTVQGWADSPLLIGTQPVATAPVQKLDEGRPLATAVGASLRSKIGTFDVAYSADGKRHYETATYILQGGKQSRLTVTQDARLREVNFGQYEGKENKELWSAAVEYLGYTIDHDAASTAPADATGQNGGWQTMQGIAITEHGLYGMMEAIKAVADAPDLGLPAEDCTEVDTRMTQALTDIAKKAQRAHDDTVLVVSSGLSISCFAGAPDMRTVDGGIPVLPSTGVPNLGVTKVIYKNGVFTIDGAVGTKDYYPQG